MDYKMILEKKMPITFDNVGIEGGKEVERMWLSDIVDGKWVEDYFVVERTSYDIETDKQGAVFALIDNGMMLVKAPNVKRYRIPESVYRIADNAFGDCSEIEELDVPYLVNDYEIDKALKHCSHQFKVHLWNWPYDKTRSEEIEKEIAEGVTDEYGFVYSKDHKKLLKAVSTKTYSIPEGVEKIDRLAFVNCVFEVLHVPYTCKLAELSDDEYPIFGNERFQGCIWPWDKPYDQEDEIENPSFRIDETEHIDEYGVAYSSSKKRLLWANSTFDESEYNVKDGVETICSNAFAFCKRFLTLSVPSSIKVIGDDLFGEEGGRIIIRKE